MADATDKVAKSFPDTKFAIVDFPQDALKSKPANVQGLLFKENEAGYLAGYMAGLYVKDKGGEQVISTVGGQKIPPVDGLHRWLPGRREGRPSRSSRRSTATPRTSSTRRSARRRR
jgi:basic membrane lipoprotein Med (substrate-binding protein (PBP1-ABC) superfamily)